MQEQDSTYISRALWLLLIALFLFSGLTGHDPWKQDETYSFGIIYHFYATHSWLVPVNAGEPFLEKPPLYYWTAVFFCKVLGGLMPLHDAARLAGFFFMALATWALWQLSQVLFSAHPKCKTLGWASIALFLGSFGVVRHAHDMFTDVALLAGTTITLWGMAILVCTHMRWKAAGLWLGIGIGIAFLSKGFFVPLSLGLSAIALWLMLPPLRTRQTMFALIVALIAASPFLIIWPLLLYQYSPDFFRIWFWDNNIGRFLGFSVTHLGADNKPFYVLYTAVWFAFPSFPLACVRAVCGRSRWRDPQYLLPITVAVTSFALLLISASARALYLLPLFPVFALLGADALASDIRPTFLARWNRIVSVIFTLGGVLLWLSWVSLLHPDSLPALAHCLSPYLPIGFIPPGNQLIACLMAAVFFVLWCISFRLPVNRVISTAYIWLAGMALLWGTAYTLLLPWIDETKSYRPVLVEMQAAIRHSPYAGSCIGNYILGESVGPMLEYVVSPTQVIRVRDFHQTACRLMLVASRRDPEHEHPEWKLLWKGTRTLDAKDDELRLYGRK